MADETEICLDSVLETVLATSGKDANRQDALVLALHVCLMADGFNLVAIGDEVLNYLNKAIVQQQSCLCNIAFAC